MIPQYTPKIDRASLAKEVNDYILSDGYFTEYKKTEEFERAISYFLNVKHCFMVNNGTLSLSLALLANGIKPGDLVMVPNITMIATSNAVKFIGAHPVFIDVDPVNLCMDLKAANTAIAFSSGAIKAVIYVTLNGRSHPKKDLDNFYRMCYSYGVKVVEDNAQSFGSLNDCSEYISSPKDGIGSFSFSMPKIITTGQGGCLVTNNDKLADKIKKLKDFGRTTGGIDFHEEFGINAKFTEIQAIMGLNQLRNIQERINNKWANYTLYSQYLSDLKRVYMLPENQNFTPWFVDIYIEDREKLQAFLKLKGIGSRAIYPELTSQKVNARWLHSKTKKVSGKFSSTGLWLPSSIDLTAEDIAYICEMIKEFYK